MLLYRHSRRYYKINCGVLWKGAIIGVEGRLFHRKYEIFNDKTFQVLEVVAKKVSFIQTKPMDQPVNDTTDPT